MDRDKKIKVIGTAVFIILLLGISLLIYHTNKTENKDVIEAIKITGNNLLGLNDYLNFTRLNDLSYEKRLSLPVIKSRFEKHPYVTDTDVKLIKENEAEVFIKEKRIYGVIIRENEPFFITDEFQILPVFSNTKMPDVPVLSNLNNIRNIEPLQKFINDDIIQAFRIIDVSELIESKVLKDLSEINLRNGGDVILTYSGINVPVIFGRGNEAAKTVCLEALLTDSREINNFLIESGYIDLRFRSYVYVGKTRKTES